MVNSMAAAPDRREKMMDNEDTGGRGRLVDTSQMADEKSPSSMEKISEVFPKVKAAYDSCLSDSPPHPGLKEDCIWEEIGEDEQAKVIKYLDEEKKAQEDQEGEAKKTSSQGVFRKTKSKSSRRLEEYLKEKLAAVLFDKDAKGSKVLSDHAKFYRIYKSQIGQNIIRISADACIYADPNQTLVDDPNKINDNFGWISEGNNDFKKENTKNLTVQSTTSTSRATPQAYVVFEECLKTIPLQCKKNGGLACKVLKYMEQAKNGIKDIDGISEELKKYSDKNKSSDYRNAVQSQERKNDKGLANAVVLTSGDIEKAGLSDIAKEESAILKNCQGQEGLATGDCALYLTDAEQKKEIEQEYMIRHKAEEERVKQELEKASGLDDQKIAITNVLKEEGLSDEKIEEFIAKNIGDLDQAISDIKSKYEKKRIAIIKDLTSRTGLVNKANDPTGNANPNKQQFSDLAEKSDNKIDNLKQSIQFANIVGSFIQVGKEGSNELMNNTTALVSELNDSGFSDSKKGGLDTDDMNTLKEMAGQSGDSDTLPDLQADNIENIIYDLGNDKK